MQITLDENEIKLALVAYATSIVQLKDGQEIEIDMKAGRGDNGYSATLNITTKVPAAPVKNVRATKPAVVESAKPEVVTSAAASVKTGLFNKTPVLTEAPKEEPVAEAEILAASTQAEEGSTDAEAVAGISTGEDRGDGPEATTAGPVEDTAQPEVPAEKPKSIFNFSKSAANG